MLLIVAISQYLIFYRNTLRNRFMIFMYLDIQLMARCSPTISLITRRIAAIRD